jgi:hypothetical protein
VYIIEVLLYNLVVDRCREILIENIEISNMYEFFFILLYYLDSDAKTTLLVLPLQLYLCKICAQRSIAYLYY